MAHFLLVVHVIIAACLIGMVLIQRSESDGFGLGSGSNSNLLSGRSTANLMTRTTAILAALFIISSLALSVIAAHGGKQSIVTTIEDQESTAPQVPVGVGADEKTNATEIGINRDAVIDTNEVAKKAVKKKASAPVSDDAPAVPAAQ
jgi:preprotein translocase subunit SecG